MSDWIDLSMEIYPDIPRMTFLPCPGMERISEAGEGSLQVHEVTLVTHIGTHFDAAAHAIPDGTTIDGYGMDRWITGGVVHEVDVEPLSPIDVDDVAPAADTLRAGDALILRTGWEDRAGDESYQDHPYFAEPLVDWLLDREVNWVGMDFLTPDKPSSIRGEDFDYPIHNGLLGNDVLIAENLTNLEGLGGRRVEIAALPLPLRGLDGSPARIAARPEGAA